MRYVLLTILFSVLSICLLSLSGYGISGSVTLDFVPPMISVVSPNGGEIWYNQATYDIEWSYSDSNPHMNGIWITYYLNDSSGTIFYFMIDNDGVEPWVLPQVSSSTARIRIDAVDFFGNYSTDYSDNYFMITGVMPPMMPQNVTVTIINNEDALISWNAVTHNTLGYPVTPDGYIVLYSEVPSLEFQYFYFLTETSSLSATHHRVARFRDDMYYRVIAYIDEEGRMAEFLSGLQSDPNKVISWAELKRDLPFLTGGEK
jgi:hypothetical protein